jgi:hypothetical protein
MQSIMQRVRLLDQQIRSVHQVMRQGLPGREAGPNG